MHHFHSEYGLYFSTWMSMRKLDLEQLIKSLYSALIEPEGFRPFFSNFTQQFNLRSGGVLMANKLTGETNILWIEGFSLDELATFNERFEKTDPLVNRLIQADPGEFLYAGLEHEMEVKKNHPEYYEDWICALDIRYAAGAVLAIDGEWISQLVFQRRGDQGDFTENDTQILKQLLPHIQHAMHLYHLKVAQDKKQLLSQLLFDQIQLPVILVDENGNVCHQNNKATLYLDNNTSMKIINRRIHWNSMGKTQEINQAIQSCISGCNTETLHLNSNHLRPVTLTVTPLLQEAGQWNKGAVVFIFNPDSKPTLDLQTLVELFNLSKNEGKVCCELVNGRSPAEIADLHYLSHETVRTYIKRVMKKTGTSRQNELVAKLMASPAFYSASTAHSHN